MSSRFSNPDLPVITAMGCVSPLGCNAAETRSALLAGFDGIVPVRLFPVAAFHAKTAGQVPDSFANLAEALAPESITWPRSAKLILLAINEALMARPRFRPDMIVAGTTSGGMDFGEAFFRGSSEEMDGCVARRWARGYVSHQPLLNVVEHLGYDAPLRVVSNACASGTNALGLAAGLVRNGYARRVLALGFDALAEMVFAGFDALRAATPEKCRPFDVARSGLALGEGAAAFFVERQDEAIDAKILASIQGYGFANDNYHLTQPDPSGAGPRMSMQRALADARWSATDVDYINAHGTGTPFNDSSEAAAIRSICPQAPVSSTKGMTGHALGAAGAIEAAYCIHAMHGEFLPPNINLRESDAHLDIVANTARPAKPRRVLSNSFGFGGANATILLEKWDT